ncbi:MAG: hypothetical protein DRN07_08700, partial [Thermoplasmata archaeon]
MAKQTPPEATKSPEVDPVPTYPRLFDFDRQRIQKVDDQKNLTQEDVLQDILQRGREAVLPWEKVMLPSRGLYYDGLIPDGIVDVRPMGLDVEKILATTRFAQDGRNLDMMFQRCVKF